MPEPTLIDGQAGLEELFAGVLHDFEQLDWGPWLTGSMRSIEQEHQLMWGEQRDPAGDPWAALAPSTVRAKGHSTILVETGRLRASLTNPNEGIREMFQENGNIGLVFGTDVPHSLYHIRGTSRMPKRDHVGIGLGTFERMVDTACDHALAELSQ